MVFVLLAAAALSAARVAAEHNLPRKACRFLTYITTVQTSGVNANLFDHLMLGLYYANEPCRNNRVIS